MIDSASTFADGAEFWAPICVVGAGPAGITLALRLAAHGQQVLLLEGGSEVENADNAAMYRGEVADPVLHSPAHHYRHRVLGGASATWGGRCIPFDPIDFEKRDWVPDSGWPITYQDVARYYPEAMQIAEAGEAIFSGANAVEGGMRPTIKNFAPAHFDSDRIERFSCPTNFGRRYRRHLADSDRIRLLLDANCTEIVPTDDSRSVDHIVLKTFAGATLTVKADRFVLATGGIEVPRLLLSSRRRDPAGIGNHADLVGRYYMCHIAGTTGEVHFTCDPSNIYHGYDRSWDGIYCRRHFQLRPEAQRELRAANVVLRLHHPRLPNPDHGRGILSTIYLAKPFIPYEYSKRLHGIEKMTLNFLLRHIANVLREPLSIASFLTNWMWRRTFAARKFPTVVVRPRNNVYCLEVHSEQVPNPGSRITLSTESDRFGMPRVKIDWRYQAFDIESVQKAVAAFGKDVSAAGIGWLEVDPCAVSRDMLRDGAFGGHHIGTTRMSNDPAKGVVDPNCRVHGVENLYIASSSVFPTSGQANPTLTILALSLRLADHLGAVGAPASGGRHDELEPTT